MSTTIVETASDHGGQWRCAPSPEPTSDPELGRHLRSSDLHAARLALGAMPPATRYVALAIDQGLTAPATLDDASRELTAIADAVPFPVLLWVARGTVAHHLAELAEFCRTHPELRLAFDVPNVFAANEMTLGPLKNWTPTLTALAANVDILITGPGTAEHDLPDRRPSPRSASTIGAHLIARTRQRAITRLVGRTAPPPVLRVHRVADTGS